MKILKIIINSLGIACRVAVVVALGCGIFIMVMEILHDIVYEAVKAKGYSIGFSNAVAVTTSVAVWCGLGALVIALFDQISSPEQNKPEPSTPPKNDPN
jgi:hypothetical protein